MTQRPRHRIARIALLTWAVALLAAGPASAALFPGDALDGPADIPEQGGVDVSRDATAAASWVRRDPDGAHVYVSRMSGGAFGPPERVDPGQGGGSAPRVAVSDEGRVVATWVDDGALWSAVAPETGAPFGPPMLVFAGAPVADPQLDMSVHGVAYVVFTSGGDIRAARLTPGGWNVIDAPLDANPGRQAGAGEGRPRLAAGADGTAIAVWGEDGGDGRSHVFVRRIIRTRPGTAIMDASVPNLQGRTGLDADAADVDLENDASYGQVVLRQAFDDGGPRERRIFARRLVGSELGPPQIVDDLAFPNARASAGRPRIAINGKGAGFAVGMRENVGAVLASRLQSDVFSRASFISPVSGGPTPVDAAVGERTTAFVGWQQDATLRARAFDDDAFGPERTLSRPEWGPASDTSLGPVAASDRVGNAAVSVLQGEQGQRRMVVAVNDLPPGRAKTASFSRPVRTPLPTFRWDDAVEPWGAVRYRLLVDGVVVGETDGRALAATTPLRDGTHRWRVDSIDRRGQLTPGTVRTVRVATGPILDLRGPRTARVRGVARFKVRARAANGKALPRSTRLTLDFGDRTRPVRTGGGTVAHRFARPGRLTVRLVAVDRARKRTTETLVVRVSR